MAIVPIAKIRLFVHRNDAPAILNVIHEAGVVEFTNVAQTVANGFEQTVRFLSHYEAPSQGLAKLVQGNRIFTTKEELARSLESFNPHMITRQASELEEYITHAEEKLKNLHEEKLLLSEWQNFNLPLDVQATKRTTLIFLNGLQKDQGALAQFLTENKIRYELVGVDETKLVLIVLTENTHTVETFINTSDLEVVNLPRLKETPHTALRRLEKEEEETKSLLHRIQKDAAVLGTKLELLKRASDFSRWEKAKQNLADAAPTTKDVLIFEGWCPKRAYQPLSQKLANTSSLTLLEEITPEENETPPVLIENPALVKPFESITELYGLPATGDLDPTLFLAGFFFIFFGLSLTDVGYGAILALLTGSLLLFFNFAKGVKKLLGLLFLGGISAMLIGFLFGGYFGIDIKELPIWLQALQRFDPIANPLPVLYVTLGLGVVQVMVGLVLKIVRDAKLGLLRDGLLDQVPWLALFVSLILLGAEKFEFFAVPIPIVWLVYASLAAIVMTQGRKEKGVVKKFFMGLIGLYGFVGYFSDILSYSRLLALGLATTALAFAVNLIAGIIGESIPYVGFIFMYVILIVGHIFNLLVNVLGAFIHSARLQFVEFFSKFITGTGRSFNAFRREGTYVVLE